MSIVSESNKRIAKNTSLLYIRMLLTMGVSFFTTREVLRILGVEDFGIYNVVGGIVVLFSFLNNAMTLATQRFLNYEIGKKDHLAINRVFVASVTIHVGIALVVSLLAETVGLWFVNTYMSIPENKVVVANVVYQFCVLSMMVNILRAPYNAAIIAYERMNFFAYVSVVEVLLKLTVVYVLLLVPSEKLIAYAILIFLVILIITFVYYSFCQRQFAIANYYFFWDKKLYATLLKYSSWSMLGSVANVGVAQGVSILINIFFGVAVNAAAGIANQVNVAVYNFVANFQMAFNPQLVKLFATGQIVEFKSLILRASKFSFFLLWAISLPILLCCHELLSLWLGEVPDYTVNFCILSIAFSLIDAVQGPLWVSVQATGNIKNYQFLMSILILLNIPISYACLSWGYPPEVVFSVRVLINIVTAVARVLFLRKILNFSIKLYVVKVCMPCLLVFITSLPLPLVVYYNTAGFLQLVFTMGSAFALAVATEYLLGLTSSERTFINNMIRTKLLRK